MRYLIMLAILLNVLGIIVTVNRNNAQAVQEPAEWLTYRLYEDGSYRGKLTSGETITGCLANGICQD